MKKESTQSDVAFDRTVAIAFDKTLHEALKRLSQESGLTFASLVRRACYSWLPSEDAQSVREAGQKAKAVLDEFRLYTYTEKEPKKS